MFLLGRVRFYAAIADDIQVTDCHGEIGAAPAGEHAVMVMQTIHVRENTVVNARLHMTSTHTSVDSALFYNLHIFNNDSGAEVVLIFIIIPSTDSI